MSNENQSFANPGRAQKKAQFAGPAQSKNRLLLALVAAGVLAVAGYAIMRNSGGSSSPQTMPAATVRQDQNAGEVRIPLKDLEGGRAKFFEHRTSGGTTVRFFAVKSADGAYRAALDACEICFRAKQGYVQEGDQLLCRKCGRKFPVNKVNDVEGGCHPIGVTRTVEGDQLVIKTSDLERGAEYF